MLHFASTVLNIQSAVLWCGGWDLTLGQSAGLGDLPVVEEADAAGQRPERHHTSTVLYLAAGVALQD